MTHLEVFSVCRIVREIKNILVNFLTAKTEEDDKLEGYEYGVDNCMRNPLNHNPDKLEKFCISSIF